MMIELEPSFWNRAGRRNNKSARGHETDPRHIQPPALDYRGWQVQGGLGGQDSHLWRWPKGLPRPAPGKDGDVPPPVPPHADLCLYSARGPVKAQWVNGWGQHCSWSSFLYAQVGD